MIKRGWFSETRDSSLLEAQFMQFFGVDNLENVPHLCHAARKSYYDKIPAAQLAWLFRARNLARTQSVPKYSETSLREGLDVLKGLLTSPEEISRIPLILSNAGVRFVIVEGLSSSKIDGVCFWLDEFSPVISMSLRFDRIDNFWFVLRHEIEHVLRKDGKDKEVIDIDVGGIENENLHQREKIANKEASEFLLSSQNLNSFIKNVKPYYSEKKILEFAREMNVHPAIVVGQLQYRKEIGYGVFKKHMTKVKDFILDSALIDGWGYIPK
jgi:HTH-type transcriptional regulator/antitoxin HigA